MKNKYIFVTAKEWFENTSLRNPISSLDHKLEKCYPELYSVHYEIKLLVTKQPSKEDQLLFHNEHWDQFGSNDIRVLDTAVADAEAKNIFLNGFNQDQFRYIAPKLKDTAEVIYFFKCPRIYDLSVLSQFSKLKCVHMYWNNSLECLWDMTSNKQLKVISCTMVSKLRKIEMLKNSYVEYVNLDSSDNCGRKKTALFDAGVFEEMPCLKHLALRYTDYEIDC